MKPRSNIHHPSILLMQAAMLGVLGLSMWSFAQDQPPAAAVPASVLSVPCLSPVVSNSSGLTDDSSDLKAFGDKKYFWKKKDLHIRFMDGSSKLQQRVIASASQWTQYANLNFNFDNAPNAEIRISFAGTGHWSLVGTQSAGAPQNSNTMNLQINDSTNDDELNRVTLHEFGHAIGLMHEHRQPGNPIKWNKPVVYAWYAAPPNNWSHAMVDEQVFKPYNSSTNVSNGYHPDSIMHYPILSGWTTDGFTVGWNRVLVQSDKDFVKQWYPGK